MPPKTRFLPVLLLLCALSIGACASEEQKFEQHLDRAEALLESGNTKAALIELRSALKLRPQHAETNHRIGRVLMDQQRYLDALIQKTSPLVIIWSAFTSMKIWHLPLPSWIGPGQA